MGTSTDSGKDIRELTMKKKHKFAHTCIMDIFNIYVPTFMHLISDYCKSIVENGEHDV